MDENRVKKRALAATERDDLIKVLTTADFPGAGELLRQVPATSVAGGIPTLLDLAVEGGPSLAPTPNGPVPGRWVVEGPAGELQGELLVWVKDGLLDGFEFAWVTDEPPAEFPPPERVRKLGRHEG